MRVSALELLELLPTELLDDLAKQTKVDYKVHKLKGKIMFNLLLYGMLEEDRMSLRSLEDSFHNPKFKFFFDIPNEMTDSKRARKLTLQLFSNQDILKSF